MVKMIFYRWIALNIMCQVEGFEIIFIIFHQKILQKLLFPPSQFLFLQRVLHLVSYIVVFIKFIHSILFSFCYMMSWIIKPIIFTNTYCLHRLQNQMLKYSINCKLKYIQCCKVDTYTHDSISVIWLTHV